MNDSTVILSGGLAGLSQVITGHPLDTIKVRYINDNIKKKTSILSCVKKIKGENCKNFYKGLSSPLLGSLIMNIQTFYFYSLFNYYCDSSFISGSLTGVILASVESPTDLIKSRLQINPSKTYRQTIKELGVKNMYKGILITLARNFSSVGFYFWGYEAAKNKFENVYLGALVGGSFAGLMCWGPSYPLDNIKTRIQTDTAGKYKGIIDCVKKIYKQNGYKGFWTGFTPCVARSMIVNPFVFATYEIGVNFFK